MSIKAFIAIVVCKCLRFAARVLHRGGTAMPGEYALKICPELLSILSKDVKTIAVTGTNGKTTSARMIEEGFASQGKSFFSNRSGANLISGITTEFVINSSLSGKCRKEYAVIECDEAAAVKVFRQMKPKVAVVTNLFSDQVDRFGDVTYTRSVVYEAIKGVPDTVLCLNADCPLTASLAEGVPNRVVFYGVDKGAVVSKEKVEADDASDCMVCGSELVYDYVVYGHLGGFRCPECGFARREPDYAVTDILRQDMQGSTIVLSVAGEKHIMDVNLPAVYNIYNAAGAAAAINEIGLGMDAAGAALATFKCGFGRMEQFDDLGKAGAKMMLVKNAAGCNQVIDFLGTIKEKFALLLIINNRVADGTDISWLEDTNFEKLCDMKGTVTKIMVSGDRLEEMEARLIRAGVDESFISAEKDYDKLIAWTKEQEVPVLIMPTYTAMMGFREVIIRNIGGEDFWK